MKAPLRLLHLEDNQGDADLCRALLEKDGLCCDITGARNAAEFHAALGQGGFDAILCDHSLPDYDGMRALARVREVCPDVPLIFVSGELGEDAAIAALKNGATDYVLKKKLARLAASVRRAVAESEERREHQRAEQAVRERDNLLRSVLSSLSAHIAVVDAAGVILAVNRAWQEFADKNGGSLLTCQGVGMNYLDVCRRAAPDSPEAARALAGIESVLQSGATEFVLEYPCSSPAGERWFLLYATPLISWRSGAVLSHMDITQRKLAELERESMAQRLRKMERQATLGQLVARVVADEHGGGAAALAGETGHATAVVELDRLLQHYERLLTAAEHPNAPPELTAAAESARAEVNGHVVNNLCRLLLGLTEFARSTDAAALPLAEGSPTAPLVAALEETIEVLNQTRHSFRSRSLGGLRERLEKLLATRR